jgi:L-cysteate sulfo-lyase
MPVLPHARFPLGHLPTPVEFLARFSRRLGGPQVYVKRDDCTGLAFGGNKTRKLEFFLGDALRSGADTLLTAGAAQSNHCRQTAAAAVRAGMPCHLLLGGSPPDAPGGNLFLDQLLGAAIHWSGPDRRGEGLESLAGELRARGKKPYIIPYGGSSAVGALGYVEAMHELTEQAGDAGGLPDAIVFASSSGGTHAGLVVGARRTRYRGRIIGIGIDKEGRPEGRFAADIANLVRETFRLTDPGTDMPPPEILLREELAEAGYGVITEREREAITLLARDEALLLDPVYTGRAMAGLIALIRNGEFAPRERVLFWHTGGGPSLLASSRGLQGP